eukprot:GILJ01003311.1.p1 GENE.GILJ01003311.1~~GILJ01003311.1.p1  ORF type:complete len:1123 (-),score=177.83 GILJ01003311.1:99-3467(-)
MGGCHGKPNPHIVPVPRAVVDKRENPPSSAAAVNNGGVQSKQQPASLSATNNSSMASTSASVSSSASSAAVKPNPPPSKNVESTKQQQTDQQSVGNPKETSQTPLRSTERANTYTRTTAAKPTINVTPLDLNRVNDIFDNRDTVKHRSKNLTIDTTADELIPKSAPERSRSLGTDDINDGRLKADFSVSLTERSFTRKAKANRFNGRILPDGNFILHGEDRSKLKENNKKADQAIMKAAVARNKTDFDIERIRKALTSHFICSALNKDEIDAVIDNMKNYEYRVGSTVFHQGDIGKFFYIVDKGSFEVTVNGSKVNTLQPGQSFGELALVHNCPRSATVTAAEDSCLWGVDRLTFRNIVSRISARTFQENRDFLDSVSLFTSLTDSQKAVLADMLVTHTFPDGYVIVREGDPGDWFGIIKEGVVACYVGNSLIRKMSRGDFFGERALIYDEPRSASVVAVGEVTVVTLARSVLQNFMGPLQDLLYINVQKACIETCVRLSKLAPAQIDVIIKSTTVLAYEKGDVVVEGGSRLANKLMMILEGELTSRDRKPPIVYSRGRCLGEEFLLIDEQQGDDIDPTQPRVDSESPTTKINRRRRSSIQINSNVISEMDSTLIAKSNCKIAEITKQKLREVLGGSILDVIDFNARKTALKNVYILRLLTEQQLDFVAKALVEVPYGNGETIIYQDDPADTFFIVRKGQVVVERNGKKLRHINKGDYFGERALLYDEKRSASIIAEGDVKCWRLDKSSFFSIVQGPMLRHLEQRIKMQDEVITLADLEQELFLGAGMFGKVHLVRHKETNSIYAMKEINKLAIVEFNQQKSIESERMILSELDHPFVLKLVKALEDSENIYFLTEFIKGCELYQAIRDIGLLDRTQSQFYAGALLLALNYLHERNIIYRDLKPENVMIDSQGYPKLIDFGIAKKTNGRTYTIIGTPQYMAPEVILGKGYTKAVDIWALGICLYEFICGPLPFGEDFTDPMEIFQSILKGQLSFPDYVDDAVAIDLISRCLTPSPELRIGCRMQGIKELLDHPYFSGIDFNDLLTRNVPAPFTPNAPPAPVNPTSPTATSPPSSGMIQEPMSPGGGVSTMMVDVGSPMSKSVAKPPPVMAALIGRGGSILGM